MANTKKKVMACSREQAINVISDYIGERCAYHNHKENMAHVGAALYFGAFGSVLVAEQLPLQWLCREWRIGAIVAAFILALIYVKWQLKNRRETAVLVAAAMELRFRWMAEEPNKLCLPKKNKPSFRERSLWCVCFVWGHFWPNHQEIEPLPGEDQLPCALVCRIPCHKRSGAIWHERILVLAMWALFLATFSRFLCTHLSLQMFAVWALLSWFSFLGTAVSA